MKDSEIYAKYEFRLSHEEKQWLQKEIDELKEKFNDANNPAVMKNNLVLSALKHGIQYLKSRDKLGRTD